MKITLIANTELKDWPERFLPPEGRMTPERVVELGGRLCYESWDRPNPKTADLSGYICNIVRQGHFSVLEHVSATLLFQEVSRNLTHELVRHRHLSFSEKSFRFVDSSEPELVLPPALDGKEIPEEIFDDMAFSASQDYQALYHQVEGTRKQKREAARAALPGSVATSIVVTGNARAWRHFLLMRGTKGADAEIFRLAHGVYATLSDLWPNIMADLIIKDGEIVTDNLERQ